MPRCRACRRQVDRVRYEGVPICTAGREGYWLEKSRRDLILPRRSVQMPEPVKRRMIEIADAVAGMALPDAQRARRQHFGMAPLLGDVFR